jgi:hypothetical protein
VQVKHNTHSGFYCAVVNGHKFDKSDGHTIRASTVDKDWVIVLDLGASLPEGRITIKLKSYSAAGFRYQFMLGDEVQKEANEVIGDPRSVASSLGPIVVRIPESEIRPSSTELAWGGKPKQVVYYSVTVARGERETTVLRRFSEFITLNNTLRGAFTGSHLLSSFPPPPSRSPPSLFSFSGRDTLAPEFIDGRKRELEVFVQRLVGMPKVLGNPDLLAFLGLDMVTGGIPDRV